MTLIYYKDRAGKFRWRLKSRNGRIVSDSAQGYVSKRSCREGWALTCGTFMPEVVQDW